MKYSSVGVSGLDVLFMSDAEREVFYQRIPLFTTRELQTIMNTIKLNQEEINRLNLRKDQNTPEFSMAYDEMRKYKDRFFKTTDTPKQRFEELDNLPSFNGDMMTSEFTAVEDVEIEEDLSNLFMSMAQDIESEFSLLDELEAFILAGGKSENIRTGIDKRVMENNFLSVQAKYNKIPADVKPLMTNSVFQDTAVLNTVKALSKRVYLSDIILSQMMQENKNTLVDITIHGRINTSTRRIGIYKRFSERHKTTDELRFTLTQITRKLNNLSSDDMAFTDTDQEFELLYRQSIDSYEHQTKSVNTPIEKQVLQLVPLFKVLKEVQLLEYSEIFGTCNPTRKEVIRCSRMLAVAIGITGLIPGQEEILAQNVTALNIKPIATSLTDETVFVMEILAMSLVSEKYGMVMGVHNR